MVDPSVISISAVTALRTAKLPPFLHPTALAAAAKQCVAFGGEENALNAAVDVANALQSHMMHAQRANVLLPPLPAVSAVKSAATRECLSSGRPNQEISEQAMQAMAAAQATNETRTKKTEEVQPTLAMPVQMPVAMADPGLPPFVPPMLLAAPPMLIATRPMGPMVQLQPTAIGPPPLCPPVHGPAFVPAPFPSLPREPPIPAPVVQLESTPEPQPKVAESRWEERKEDESRSDNKKRSAAEDDSNRCHLHRKPQLNCKICRRVYYTALDPAGQRRDDRAGKDGSAASGSRWGADDDGSGGWHQIEAFEITNKQTFNFNPMLRDQILKNTYFKTLVGIDTFEGIVEEMYKYTETAEVYGAGTTTVPSTLFCCLYRLFTIGLSCDELNILLESRDWPYLRCCGILYIRFGCAPEKLWDLLGGYCLDDQDFEPSKAQPNFVISVGEYVEAILMDERYYFSTLPRIPVGVKKKIEEQAAPLVSYRKRTVANKSVLHLFSEPGTEVEVCSNNGWESATVVQVIETIPTRLMVKVRLKNDCVDVYHLGKVILRDTKRGRSRSRSPRRARDGSPDLTRYRGKSKLEMLDELRTQQRERAVCTSGKDYARKPIGFMSGLALKRDMGVASTRLREEETYAPRQSGHRRQATEEDEMERRREIRERDVQDHEKRAIMQQLHEKYGTTQQPQKPKDQLLTALPGEEQADVLRLG